MTASSVDNGTLCALMDKVYSNTRTDASNAIGNGNKRTLHTDITGVELKFTIVSGGATAGKTSVTISPSGPDAFPIRYLYKGTTWWHSANQAARCAGKGLLVYGAGFQRDSSPYSNNFRRLTLSGFS